MRAELAIVAVLMSGCSVVTMERSHRSHRPETTPRCTSTWRPQVLDAIGAFPFAMQAALSESDGYERAAKINGVIAGAFVASALYGWIHRGWCREAFDAHDRYLRTHAALPASVGPPGAEPVSR